MSQNFGNENTFGSGASLGATDAGTTRDTTAGVREVGNTASSDIGGTGSTAVSTGGGTGAATAPAQGGIGARAKEYGQQLSEYGQHAKEYISDKASVVGDKIQDLRNKDYAQMAEEAKDYARQNPGQALLVAAAAGFVIGLLVRGGRR